MKFRHITVLLVLAALLALGLAGCEFLGTSIQDRIGMFAEDLTSNRDNAYLNFDPTTTQWYNAIKAAGAWDANFPAPAAGQQPYEVTLDSYSDPLNVTGTIVGPPAFVGPHTIQFVMVQVDADWFIQQIYMDGDTTNAIVKELF